MKYEETWVGLGLKPGGHFFVGGLESITGMIWNLGNPGLSHHFTMKSTRLGPGLGAGGDLVVVYFFKTKDVNYFHGKKISDWGVNIDFGKIGIKTLKTAAKFKGFINSLKMAESLKSIASNLPEIRDGLHVVYNEYEMTKINGPKIIFMEIPVAGLEISAFWVRGTMRIDSQPLPDTAPATFPTKGRMAP